MDEENSLDSFVDNESQPNQTLDDIIGDLGTTEPENVLPKIEEEKSDVHSQEAVADVPETHAAPEVTQAAPTDMAARPKLKKIKRLKIRPMSDVPVAPQKIQPDETAHADITDNKTADDFNDDFNDDFSDDNIGTSLVTSTDAKNISSDRGSENSYILEGLPPELDYVAGDSDDAVYQESGILAYKKPLIMALGCFLFGMLLGAIFFSTKTEEAHGLEDVVLNPDVPQGRARCGLTDKSQACIFYIMNCYKQELTGRDFFKLAATLTGREEYMIETDNLRYATVKIKPGYFAQVNIPALK